VRLRLSPYVPGDLEEIADYIAKDSPLQALRFLRAIHARIKEISRQSQIYRLRPEVGVDARLASAGHYVILFRIRGDVVRIERVLHGSRNLLSILGKIEE